jgi:pimeloyl-ACP methyl ester carboxylesterase
VRGYVATTGGLVHYRAAGSSGPAVVLLHETPLSSAVFEPLLARLGESLRAWALDTPGYGLSDPPSEPCSIGDYARVLLEAIDELGLDTFVLVGARTGAHIAFEIARRAKTRVPCLVVTGVLLISPEERAARLESVTDMATNAPASLELDSGGAHLQWAWNRYQRNGDTPLDLVNLSAVHVGANPNGHNWGYAAAFAHEVAPLLEGLDQPTLILTSGADPMAEYDEPVLCHLRNGSLRLVEGDFQKAYWEAPDAYAAAVLDFVHEQGEE